MKFFETEQKYRLKNPKRIRSLLKRFGAGKIAQGTETNEIFDCGHFLRNQKVILRLRRFAGKNVLTLKGPRLKSRFTRRMEIETPVEGRAARALLKFFGCRKILEYSKQRETYRCQGTVIAVDFLPEFGWFLEIEGAPKKITVTARRLGLRESDREEKSYLRMLFGIRQ